MTPERFRQIREGLGLSQKALGERLGKAEYTVFRYERGPGAWNGLAIPPLVAAYMEVLAEKGEGIAAQ